MRAHHPRRRRRGAIGAVALTSAGMRVTIAARRQDQAQAVAALTGAAVGPWPPDPASWDLLVNATPVGTAPATKRRCPADMCHRGKIVYDLVYNPPQTKLLAGAAEAGCRTIGGLDMLVAQAQAQFEWWTGQRLPTPSCATRDGATPRKPQTCRRSPKG